jgi:hypothetical protein
MTILVFSGFALQDIFGSQAIENAFGLAPINAITKHVLRILNCHMFSFRRPIGQ